MKESRSSQRLECSPNNARSRDFSPSCAGTSFPAPSKITLSIVCAVRNGGDCIGELLHSYAGQRHSKAELIVMDGNSTDHTRNIVRDAAVADVVVAQADEGIYDAWNKALPLCRGTHVAFIGADDMLAEGAVSALVSACETASPDVSLIAGYGVLTRNRQPVTLLGEPFEARRVPYRMQIAHVMSAHSLRWLRELGGFDTSFKSAADYELLLRSSPTLRILMLSRILTYIEDGGISRRSWRPHIECYQARKKNGMPVLAALLLGKAALGMMLRKIGLR